MKIFVTFLFIVISITLKVNADTSFKDSLSLYDTFQHNRMIKDIEKRQEEIKKDPKNKFPSSYIQESEHKLLESFLAKYPENLFLHYNFGIFWIFQDIQKTMTQFLFVLKNKESDELRFKAAFNLGTLYGYDKRLNVKDGSHIDQALKYYQVALDIHPNSLETKQNIEMLFLTTKQNSKSQNKSDPNQQEQQEQKNKSKQKKNEEEKESSQNKEGTSEEQNVPYKESGKGMDEQQFQSKNLTERDVQDILGELKQQEQQIWEKLIQEEAKKQNAKNQGKGHWMLDGILKNQTTKDQGLDKDW